MFDFMLSIIRKFPNRMISFLIVKNGTYEKNAKVITIASKIMKNIA